MAANLRLHARGKFSEDKVQNYLRSGNTDKIIGSHNNKNDDMVKKKTTADVFLCFARIGRYEPLEKAK